MGRSFAGCGFVAEIVSRSEERQEPIAFHSASNDPLLDFGRCFCEFCESSGWLVDCSVEEGIVFLGSSYDSHWGDGIWAIIFSFLKLEMAIKEDGEQRFLDIVTGNKSHVGPGWKPMIVDFFFLARRTIRQFRGFHVN